MVFNSNVYEVRGGDRQGDPLSAYLVTIALDFANYYSAPKEHKRKYGGKEGYLN